VSTKRIATSFVKGDTLKDWLEWKPEDKNRFYLIEKSTGKVFKTEFLTTAAFYYLHFINCYEENNQIVADIVIYDSPNIMETMMIRTLRENSASYPFDLPYIQRFVIPIIPDLKGGNVRENLNLVTKSGSACTAVREGSKILITGEKICGDGMDLPTTNKRFFGRKTRYVYAAGTFHEHDFSNTICKVDLETKEVWRWKHSEYTYPGEPCFVPDPKGSREDDGVVITGVTDKRQGHEDFLVILDARNLKELGRAPFKSHIPSSMHGIFLPN
jgi:carotenoid cleavage dioxygenase-like enzyme